MFETEKETDLRDMISYCGHYCRECPAHLKEISSYANYLKNELDNYTTEKLISKSPDLKEDFKEIRNYQKFIGILTNLENLRCNLICKEGGGSDDCDIRDCCNNKGFEGCWDCSELEGCAKLANTNLACEKPNFANLVQIRNQGVEAFLFIKEF